MKQLTADLTTWHIRTRDHIQEEEEAMPRCWVMMFWFENFKAMDTSNQRGGNDDTIRSITRATRWLPSQLPSESAARRISSENKNTKQIKTIEVHYISAQWWKCLAGKEEDDYYTWCAYPSVSWVKSMAQGNRITIEKTNQSRRKWIKSKSQQQKRNHWWFQIGIINKRTQLRTTRNKSTLNQ